MTPRTRIKPIDNYVVRYRDSEWDYILLTSVTPAEAGMPGPTVIASFASTVGPGINPGQNGAG